MRINGLVVDAEVVRTPAERGKGLGGREALPRDEGMLFVLDREERAEFWMRGMQFPLDFIWISAAGQVADVTEGVPPPEPDTPDDELLLYQPAVPVRFVLEVNSGIVDEAGLEAGDAVTFDREPLRKP